MSDFHIPYVLGVNVLEYFRAAVVGPSGLKSSAVPLLLIEGGLAERSDTSMDV